MRPSLQSLRFIAIFTLAYLAVAMAIPLWFIDMLTLQRQFGAVLAADLLVFAMFAYVYLKPTFSQASKPWMIAGCVFLVVLLVIAL